MRILARDLISAAARLNIVGPLEGAKMQATLSSTLEELIDESLEMCEVVGGIIQPAAPIQCSPFLEIVQARHDVLYSRLFNS